MPFYGGAHLINSIGIYEKAERLVRKTGTNNVLQMANDLGIKIYYEDYENLLGMYTCKWRQRIIFLNSNLEDSMLQMVLAHELGHDFLHRDLASKGLKEFALFDLKNITEYEANAFAAHLLLDNDQVYQLAMAGNDVEQIAKMLNSHINLLLIKMQEMNRLGFNFNLSNVPRSDFLKKFKL